MTTPTTYVRLGEHGAVWGCTRCDASGLFRGPWFETERLARRAAAGHECEEATCNWNSA